MFAKVECQIIKNRKGIEQRARLKIESENVLVFALHFFQRRSFDANVSRSCRIQSGHQSQQNAFPGSAWTHEDKHFSRLDGKTQIVKHGASVEHFCDVLYFNTDRRFFPFHFYKTFDATDAVEGVQQSAFFSNNRALKQRNLSDVQSVNIGF